MKRRWGAAQGWGGAGDSRKEEVGGAVSQTLSPPGTTRVQFYRVCVAQMFGMGQATPL